MNQMLFKKLHLGTAFYSEETFDEIKMYVANEYKEEKKQVKVGGKVRHYLYHHNHCIYHYDSEGEAEPTGQG